MSDHSGQQVDSGVWARRIRILQLLDAMERADLNPLPLTHLHATAYFANVLSPIWDLRPLDGKILKRLGGPYYPELQTDVDGLVGQGLVVPSEVSYFRDDHGVARLTASYELNADLATPPIEAINRSRDGQRLGRFLRELAYAIAAIGSDEFENAIHHDATYTTPTVGVGFVIDFAEWQSSNASERIAYRFDEFVPLAGERTSPGEKLGLYIHYLDRVANE